MVSNVLGIALIACVFGLGIVLNSGIGLNLVMLHILSVGSLLAIMVWSSIPPHEAQ